MGPKELLSLQLSSVPMGTTLSFFLAVKARAPVSRRRSLVPLNEGRLYGRNGATYLGLDERFLRCNTTPANGACDFRACRVLSVRPPTLIARIETNRQH